MDYRTAESSDAENIAFLINSAYRGDSARAGWTHEDDLVGGVRTRPDEIRSLLAKPGHHILLALEENKLVGTVTLIDEGENFYGSMFAVDPRLQNRKIGAFFLDEIRRFGKSSGKKFLRVGVINVRKELIEYYQRKGFILTGNSEPFPEEYPAKVEGLRLLEMLLPL